MGGLERTSGAPLHMEFKFLLLLLNPVIENVPVENLVKSSVFEILREKTPLQMKLMCVCDFNGSSFLSESAVKMVVVNRCAIAFF